MILQVTVFCILSIPIIWVSAPSLRRPASHGFARCFAFETILALFLLNAKHWFDSPVFSLRQSLSWFFLMVAIVFVIWGVVLLRYIGGGLGGETTAATTTPTTSKTTSTKEQAQESTPLFEWENTNRLVTTGIFKYIRHPMYSSLFFLAWGIVLKSITPVTIALGVVATVAVLFTAKADEAEMIERFGQEYQDYLAQTQARFVPFLL